MTRSPNCRKKRCRKQEDEVTEEHPASGHRVHIEVEEASPPSSLWITVKKRPANWWINTAVSFNAVAVNSIDAAFQEMAKKPVSVIVSNINFGDVDGVSFLDTVRREYPNTVSVILTEVKDAQLAIRSINELNVFRYLVKPMPEDQISHTLEKAIERSKAFRATPHKNVLKMAEEIAPERIREERGKHAPPPPPRGPGAAEQEQETMIVSLHIVRHSQQ
jgi:DNA-binding NarL/FixJ family response regulator